ncbi:hypothetical protein F5Y16DRAFT_352072 [Xylariaceae sp. FL0255]|nr:hypothetical protein F5Y16DRAFT_352072 [Xylariaceae sp. FL0255]
MSYKNPETVGRVCECSLHRRDAFQEKIQWVLLTRHGESHRREIHYPKLSQTSHLLDEDDIEISQIDIWWEELRAIGEKDCPTCCLFRNAIMTFFPGGIDGIEEAVKRWTPKLSLPIFICIKWETERKSSQVLGARIEFDLPCIVWNILHQVIRPSRKWAMFLASPAVASQYAGSESRREIVPCQGLAREMDQTEEAHIIVPASHRRG